jgi:hypothetical protein
MVGAFVNGYQGIMLHAGGLVWANAIVAAVGGRANPPHFNCFSRLPDGRSVVTSDHRWKLRPQPDDLPEFLPGATVGTVVTKHLTRIEELGPVRVRADELAGLILAREQRHVDLGVEWGVYVPMTPEEVEELTGEAGW